MSLDRPRRARRRALVMALFVAACENARPTVRLDEVGRAYGEAYCGRVFACCTAEEIRQRYATVIPTITDEASCVSYLASGFQNEFGGDVRRAEFLGQARYHADAMAACLSGLEGLTCTEFAKVLLLPDCRPQPVEGLVADGAACDHDFQCRSGYCAGRLAGGPAACAPALGEGAVCPDGVCGEGLRCDGSSQPARCLVLAEDGQPCSSNLGCASGSCNQGVCGRPVRCLGTQ
jgi:hypothetical protein